MENLKVSLLSYPTEADWDGVKLRALVTVGKKPIAPPSLEWKKNILRARHSPIRYLRISFMVENLPYWVSVHFARHVHAQPYVRSQRNDRQDGYDRESARQDAPVTMIFDVNAEEMCVIANKRLCGQASAETRYVAQLMCDALIEKCPEFKDVLVPACKHNGKCNEMYPCGLHF